MGSGRRVLWAVEVDGRIKGDFTSLVEAAATSVACWKALLGRLSLGSASDLRSGQWLTVAA